MLLRIKQNFFYWISAIRISLTLTMILLITTTFSLKIIGIWDHTSLTLGLSVDWKCYRFLVVVFVIVISVTLWAQSYITSNFKLGMFFMFLISFVLSMITLILRNRILTLFIGWEGLGLTSFILIIFYQNWISTRGGLITLLTNRIGDTLLLIRARYWVSKYLTVSLRPVLVALVLLVLTTTKRAQWPFINWLPLAIRAPTPIRALVHSSTLVTAGVWVLVRLMQNTTINISTCLWLGIITLIVASLGALIELDSKKIVALSTLRQLGLMFVGISLGNLVLSLFHILTHGLAKANLFIGVGNVLHISQSEQDSRKISSNRLPSITLLRVIISTARLRGLLFIRGYFSKERILFQMNNRVSRIVILIILIRIGSLTLAYCLKLVLVLLRKRVSFSLKTEWCRTTPVVLLRRLTVIWGYFLLESLALLASFKLNTIESFYWGLLILGPALYAYTVNSRTLKIFLKNRLLFRLFYLKPLKVFIYQLNLSLEKIFLITPGRIIKLLNTRTYALFIFVLILVVSLTSL
jgi:NADH-ubiquinone oxidoreductase chain 5